ncbi:PIN domain-containing protein [Xylanimonas protaetiae]|uniref:Ribonuclease VapC n=1 Tax=Xylanimonas protaetiae TaxID=2509457 RepID=A0A4P6F8I8_9MICO|nr:PIN domain-containing protein [Xylanimonas protaetiae]QAY71203.1 PIN domain nuclease [Xylanimonas protaetiae]
MTRPAIFLPDVNVLVAAHIQSSKHHVVASQWFDSRPVFATCALTETGMVRALSSTAVNPTGNVLLALTALSRLRMEPGAIFWPDDSTLTAPFIDTTKMAGTRQVPDFHLLNLAASRGAVLVTTDARIETSIASSDRKHLLVLR